VLRSVLGHSCHLPIGCFTLASCHGFLWRFSGQQIPHTIQLLFLQLSYLHIIFKISSRNFDLIAALEIMSESSGLRTAFKITTDSFRRIAALKMGFELCTQSTENFTLVAAWLMLDFHIRHLCVVIFSKATGETKRITLINLFSAPRFAKHVEQLLRWLPGISSVITLITTRIDP
jgi:hypothetical protein